MISGFALIAAFLAVIIIMWIYEHPSWPYMTWDAQSLANKLAAVRHSQGLLLGRMQGLGFELKSEAFLGAMTSDVVQSSAIEGVHLDKALVRSSVARRLGINNAGLGLVPYRAVQQVDSIVDILLDAVKNHAKPLTKERLCAWHTALFPLGRSGLVEITVGDWRKDLMQVLSGPSGKEKLHYQAPPAEMVAQQMEQFLTWIENDDDSDPIIRAGIAHLWFETIHPFDDGNGRIGRAIADMLLARAESSAERYYCLSAQIEAERADYYNQLESQQRATPDLTPWLTWYLNCLERAIDQAHKQVSWVLYKAQFWQEVLAAQHNHPPLNQRQNLVLNLLLDPNFEGFMNSSKYAKLAKCSTDTALRDIQALVARGILIQNHNKGRSTSYRLAHSAL